MAQAKKTATYRVVTDAGGGRSFRFYCNLYGELCCVTKPLRADTEQAALALAWVNCICPGVIMTDMMKGFDEQTVQELKEETPLNMLGMPEDIAETAVFLCSDRARFITGQIVGVNGGMII